MGIESGASLAEMGGGRRTEPVPGGPNLMPPPPPPDPRRRPSPDPDLDVDPLEGNVPRPQKPELFSFLRN